MNTFGERLRILRLGKNLTGEQLGKFLSVTKVAISNWESGNRTPDADMLIKIADFFDISLDYLLGRTDDPDTIILTNKDLPVPEKYKDVDIKIGADRKTMPKVITEEMVENILQTLIAQGYEIKPKSKDN